MKKFLILIFLLSSVIQAQIYLGQTQLSPFVYINADSVYLLNATKLKGGTHYYFGNNAGLRFFNNQLQFSNDLLNWYNIPTSLPQGGGWTLGLNKIYQTTTNTPVHIRSLGSDTTGTRLLNVYGDAYVKGRVIADSGLVVNWSEPQGVVFDGVDDSYLISDNANINFGNSDFSIEFYGKVNRLSTGDNTILRKTQSGTGYLLRYLNYPNENIVFEVWSNAEGKSYIVTKTKQSGDNEHIVCVKTSSKLYLYINGILQATADIQNLNVNNTASLEISPSYALGNFTLYYLRLYNRALSQSEILKLYNNGLPQNSNIPYSDIQASNINKVVDGNFNDSTKWITQGNWVVSDGKAISNGNTTWYSIYQPNIINQLKIGKRYRVKFVISDYNGTFRGGITVMERVINGGQLITTTGNHQVEFIAKRGALTFFAKENDTTYLTIDSVELYEVGCVAEYKSENAGTMGWIETQNGLHAVGYNNPTAPVGLRDYKSGVSTTTVQLVNTQKSQTILKQVIVKNNYAGSNTFYLGTTTNANELLNGVSIANGETKVFDVNSYSATVRSLYCKAGNSNVDVTLIYEKVAR